MPSEGAEAFTPLKLTRESATAPRETYPQRVRVISPRLVSQEKVAYRRAPALQSPYLGSSEQSPLPYSSAGRWNAIRRLRCERADTRVQTAAVVGGVSP